MVNLAHPSKIRYILSRAKRCLVHGWMYFCRVFPVDRKKVLIMNYYGGGFGDNGKAIALKLHEIAPELKIIWPVKRQNHEKLPMFCKPVIFRSLKYYYEMATAAVWVDNARKDSEIVKRKNQYYIQTWHGMVALKRIEKDAQDSLSVGYLDDAKNDSKMADVILSGCGFFTKLCRSAFWYDGEILECGSPRLDVLFNQTEDTKKNVREKLGIPEGKKIILYAPTFRADGNMDCYIHNYEQILAATEEKTNEEWVFAIRLHPNIAGKAGFITYSEKLINATVYPDLYDIIPICDVVISDYSSLMFDSGLINKPVFLYASDIDAYKADRGFYFEFQDLPFPLAQCEEELIRNLVEFVPEQYQTALSRFNAQIDYYEKGNAAETVANRILEVLNK